MISVPNIAAEQKGTILFVHGMCHGAWCWNQGFMQEFSNAGYNCHAVDLPLHDKPGKNKAVNSQSIDDYVRFVKKTIDDLDDDIILIGHSMGGFITQKFLEMHACKAAILLASVPYSGILPGSLRYLLKHPDALSNLIAQDIYGPFVKYSEDLYSNATDRNEIEYYKTLMRSESFKALLNMMFKPVKKSNPSNVPLLVTGADADQVITIDEVQKTAVFHNTVPVVFKGFGHNLMLDKGYEEVSDRIISWLEDQ